LIALAIRVGLLAPFRILFVPKDGSVLWHDDEEHVRGKPLTAVVYSVWPLAQLPVANAGRLQAAQ